MDAALRCPACEWAPPATVAWRCPRCGDQSELATREVAPGCAGCRQAVEALACPRCEGSFSLPRWRRPPDTARLAWTLLALCALTFAVFLAGPWCLRQLDPATAVTWAAQRAGASDPWGRPLAYRIVQADPAGRTSPRALIYSCGPDGLDQGGEQDDLVADERRLLFRVHQRGRWTLFFPYMALLVLFLGVHTLGRPASATGEALLCAGVAATLAALLSGGFALATALFEDLDPLLQLPGGVATGAPFLSAFLTGLALWTPVVWLARRRWAPLGLSWRDA